MRNKLLPVFGLVILFSLFSSMSMGFSGMHEVPSKPVQDDRPQHHGSNRATGKSDVVRPELLEKAEEGAEKPEPDAEPGPSTPDKGTARPKAPGKSGTLTPFKPSEEIRADQAVDFPYDI